MKKLLNPKFLFIVLILSLVIFLAVTSSQQLGTEIGKKHLTEYKEKIDALKAKIKNIPDAKINRGELAKRCEPMISDLMTDISEFESHELKKEVFAAYKLIYDCQKLANHKDAVIKTLSKLIELEPQSHELHGMMAKALMNVNNLGLAQRSAHLASQINPKAYQWIDLEADILVKLNQFDKAGKLYKKALSIAPYDKTNEIARKLDLIMTATESTDEFYVQEDEPIDEVASSSNFGDEEAAK